VGELFDMMNGAREQAFQRMGQFGQPGSGQWQGQQAGTPDDGDYDHYNVEGSDRGYGGNRNWNQNRGGRGFDFDMGDNLADDIGGRGPRRGVRARRAGLREADEEGLR